MRTLSRFFLTLLIVANGALVSAGGSLGFEEIQPILERDPALGKWLLENLEFKPSASGTRLGRHWTELGGARQGPYFVDATTKDTSTPLFVTIETNITYFAGKKKLWSGEATHGEIPDELFDKIIKNADSFTETLRAVRMENVKKPGKSKAKKETSDEDESSDDEEEDDEDTGDKAADMEKE